VRERRNLLPAQPARVTARAGVRADVIRLQGVAPASEEIREPVSINATSMQPVPAPIQGRSVLGYTGPRWWDPGGA
jgi:hypothetical protein